jgi:magnesium-transporting ATPase (P-type)
MLRRIFVIKRVDLRRELRSLHNEEFVVVIVLVLVIVFLVAVIVFALYSLCCVSFNCLCSFLWYVLFERGVLFCVMCVICVLCLIAVPLPPFENPFAVKICHNKNYISPNIIRVMKSRSM